MHKLIGSKEAAELRHEILSQCTWSETYSSLKHILKRTANQLPLLISFLNTDDEQQQATNENSQTIFFFDRNLSKKLLLTPLQQREDQPDQFDIRPNHCTFVITDLFKGLFEFVLHGQRGTKIFPNLEQLISFTSNFTHPIVFMSRDRALAFFQQTNSSHWSSKEYNQGSIFRAERIHRSMISTSDSQQIPNDYLECRDEDGYSVFIKLDQTGRYSIIATASEQQENQPEIYLHSTQTPNIGQLIKLLKLDKDGQNNCLRLVRGPVPYNFLCQYFHFVRQHTHDVLVGLTQEGLVIEWNLENHVPCRYATNLNDILANLYETKIEEILESYIDQARIHYRENFQFDMQLISSRDWAAFFQYWKWNGSAREQYHEHNITYQSRHRFHLVASVQDLSDYFRALISAYKKSRHHSQDPPSVVENKTTLQSKQRSFLSQMSKLISTPRDFKKHRSFPRTSIPVLPNGPKPFDNSIYDSNQIPTKTTSINQSVRKTKHT